ncbi:MAG: hypothetical protein ACK5HY_15520 [Parahaliea sp.]
MRLITHIAVIGLVTSLAALGGCSTPGDTTANGALANNASASPEGLRCKNVIKTGTRLRSRVCKTEAQWEQDATDSRTATEGIQRTAVHGSVPTGG